MPKALYTLQVFLFDAPVSDEFFKANPVVSRTIEIRGDQTLQDLHNAIFKAFDRWEDHAYEFHFGDAPHDSSRGRYGAPSPFDEEPPTGHPAETSIDSLGLAVEEAFGYWFDFGDDWYHQVDVLAIGETKRRVTYPRVIDTVGDSPPQYINEEDAWDEDD